MWVEIGGVVVAEGRGGVPAAGCSVTTELGQRPTATVTLVYPPGVVFNRIERPLRMPGNRLLGLPGGAVLDISGDSHYLPRFWAEIAVDHPAQCYRSVVESRSPWLYWRLDDGRTPKARDASGNNRQGTFETHGLTLREVESPETGVPYGASLGVAAGTVFGPAVSDLAAPYTLLFLFRSDAAATGADEVVRVGPLAVVRFVEAGVQTLAVTVSDSQVVSETITAGEWVHVGVVREAAAVRLHVGSESDAGSTTAWSAGQHATGTVSIHASGANLRGAVDELAILPEALTSLEVADLRARVTHDRVFGGYAYQPEDAGDGNGGIVAKMKAVGYWALLDRLYVDGVWTSHTDQAAGDVMRSILRNAGWPHTADGCDKDNPIGRVVGRTAVASELVRGVTVRSSTLAWVDSWGDVHLDTAGDLRRLPVVLDETNVGPEWTRATLATRWRTRTIVVGAGVPGAIIPETFTGDGEQRTFDLLEQVRTVQRFDVDGVGVDLADSSSGWALGPEKITLVAAVPPAAGVEVSIVYVAESPLVAAAEDSAGIARYGRIERKTEDPSLDTAAAVHERAVREQVAHGLPGLEIIAPLRPAKRPVLRDVGGAPIVRLSRRGRAPVDQRMLVERLKTTWQPGGQRVNQTATLRANDFTSDLEYWGRTRGVLVPPVSTPVAPPVTDIAVEGLELPASLGGDYEARVDDTSWVDVPGSVLPIVDGHILSEVDMVVSFMAQVYGAGVARFRLWDRTRGVRVGEARELSGDGRTYYEVPGIRLAPRRSQLVPQVRNVDAASVAVWGIQLAASN